MAFIFHGGPASGAFLSVVEEHNNDASLLLAKIVTPSPSTLHSLLSLAVDKNVLEVLSR